MTGPHKDAPRYRRRLSERALAVFGAVGTLIAVGTVFAAVWTGIYAVQKPEDIINIVYGSAIIFGAVALFCVLLLAYEAISAEQALRKSEVENLQLKQAKALLEQQNAALGAQKAEAEGRIARVAEPFTNLSRAITEFEASVGAFKVYSRAKPAPDLDAPWQNLRDLWFAALESICDAAAMALPLKKGSPVERCSADIETVESVDNIPRYKVVKRSSRSSHERYIDDQRQGDRPVRKNKMYFDMLLEKGPYLIGDMDKYVHDLNNSNQRDDFDEPKNKAATFFKSRLITPIFGTTTTADGGLIEKTLVGIFCVDSLDRNFFDNDYDRIIVTQLANHALTCFRLHWEAQQARVAARASNAPSSSALLPPPS